MISVEGWETILLNEVIREDSILLGRGNIISSKDIAEIPGSYPIYSSSAKSNGEFGRYGNFMFNEELITWSIDGGGRFFYRLKHKFSVTNVCGYMRVSPSRWNTRFVYYLLDLQHKNIAFDYQTKAHPSVIKNLYFLVRLPIEEQTQIAAILSTIDRTIEQTEAIIAKQQRIKTGLMQDLLTKGIDENGNVRSEATHKFKDSPLGQIPAEWEVKTLNKVASLQRGHDIREIDLIPGNCPVIASSGIIGFHKFSTSSAPNVVVGRKGSIGNVHYIDSDFWAHDTSLFVTNFFGNHEKYVYYLFSNLKLERFGTKSGSPSLNRNDIHPLLVGIPNSTEQRKIVRVLSECDKSLTGFSEELEKNKRRKTGLMQDLLTGNVRVTALLNDRAKTSL